MRYRASTRPHILGLSAARLPGKINILKEILTWPNLGAKRE
jgi:hypothetical protein